MNKEFVPYELAVKLKELGFDEPCIAGYSNSTEKLEFYSRPLVTKDSFTVDAPTFSQAFRWFREKYNLMFQIFYSRNGNYSVIIHRTTPEYMDLVNQVKPSDGCVDEVVDCYSYEEAELACLEKLIEIVNQNKDEEKDS